jgi:hypothetical protein
VTTRWGPGEPAAGPWRVAPVDELVTLLWAAAGGPTSRPRVVAVDGRSASGKTTVAALLQAAVPASGVVHTDDVAWYESFFGWDELVAAGVLEPLHRGAAVHYRPPAWDRRERPGAVELPAGLAMVLVEGVGAARRELAGWLDAVIWVQSDAVEAERRGIERDGGNEAAGAFWQEWAAQEIPFLAAQRPWERADLIVCGTPAPAHDCSCEVVLAPRLGAPR